MYFYSQIKAIGKKISRKEFNKPLYIDRVGVILERFDIPKEFPTGFYCRREKVENTSVALKKLEDESVHSDVFHLKIFDVNRDCPVQINLPIYKAPTEKEQLHLRFFNGPLEDRPVDDVVTDNNVRIICEWFCFRRYLTMELTKKQTLFMLV